MGFAKREMMKWESLGCSPIGEKHICPNCVGDYALKQFIRDNAEHDGCDYCGEVFDEAICAHADLLIEHVARSIGYEYEDPVHSVSYCSAEGGYLLPTMDSWELLSDFDLGDFEEDARNAMDGLWIEKDPYGDRPWEYMLSSWSAFADYVKYRQRFFFPRAHAGTEDSPNASILDTVAEVASEVGLLKTLPIGTELFRSRQHALGDAPANASDLGTPPPECAVHSNRMSPAGIPMFYSAMDSSTARAETETTDPIKTQMTTGRFVTNCEITVLDLADIPDIPSLFDENKRHLRAGLRFIKGFARELALPIMRNGQEHIEYVPTQMVSEYFRTVFKLSGGADLDGLVYQSVKREYGICVCLFLAHDDFAGTGARQNRIPMLATKTTFPLSIPLAPVVAPTPMGETLPLI